MYPPPTPTFMPPADAGQRYVPTQIDLNWIDFWNTAAEIVGLWNWFGTATQVLQWVFVSIMVVGLIWFTIRRIRRLAEEEV